MRFLNETLYRAEKNGEWSVYLQPLFAKNEKYNELFTNLLLKARQRRPSYCDFVRFRFGS